MGLDGCYDVEATDCQAGEACDAGTISCQATGCTDDCVPADYPACSGDSLAVLACERQADGCYDLITTDCQLGEACDAGTFTCQATGCTDDCVPAAYPACSADDSAVETCELQVDGCYDVIATACGVNQACDDTNAPTCVDLCTDDCVPADYPACSGDNSAVETCEQQGDGCYDLVSTACGGNEACDASSGAPTCVAVCTDDCDPAGYPACSADGSAVETCELQGDGCYDLIATGCAFDQICDAGTAACIANPNCAESVADGSFEGGTPSADWAEFSTNFGTPICSNVLCGDLGGLAYARTGDYFAWFGGVDAHEEGSVSQEVRIPLGASARLQFHLYIPSNSELAADEFGVYMDTDELLLVTSAEFDSYAADYVLIELDVSAYADGFGHTLTFASITNGAGAVAVSNLLVDDISLLACDGDCIHECDVVDELSCSPDLSAIWICQTVAGSCNVLAVDTPCNAGDSCDGSVYPPVCYTPIPATPGDNCADPNLVPMDVPARLPITDFGQTNCGRGDDYSDTCLGNYDGGEDIVYQLNVTQDTILRIGLDPNGTDYTGFAIGDSCPLGLACFDGMTNSGTSAYGTTCQLYPVGLYTLMIDTWPAPDCIPAFDLAIDACACVTGATQCFDANTLQTCDGVGVWGADTVCANGCQEFGGVAQCVNPYDTCEQAFAIDVSSGSASVLVDNSTLSDQFSGYSCSSSRTGADAWYSFTLTEEAQVTVETSAPGSISDTVLALFDACGGTQLGCADDIGGGNFYSQIQLVLPAGTYYVVNEPWSTSALGDWTLTVTVVTRQPSVLWDFEAANTVPVIGAGTAALGPTLASESFPAGNPGTSWSANTWSLAGLDVDKYFEFNTSLTGLAGLALRFDERRSGTGPRDFVVHYSLDGTNFVEIPSTITNVPDDTNWRSHGFDLPAAVDDGASVTVRVYGYNAEGTSGTWRIDNVGFFLPYP
jgi:hypothetical protein